MIKKIKNNSLEAKVWCGQEIQPSEYYEIQAMEETRWANDSLLLADIANSIAIVNNGTEDLSDLNQAIDYLKNNLPKDVKISNTIDNYPFSAKILANGKKLYARVHGIQPTLAAEANTIDFTIPYSWVKITGIMVYGGEALDKVDLSIYDTAAGTYSGVPNYKLNQFGFAANIAKDHFEWTSPYDADLYQGMIIRITYTSISAKTVGINFILNEVK